MTAVEVFQFPTTGAEVRTVVRDGSPWFAARDVCAVLGISNVTDAVRSLDDDEYEVVPAALVSSEGRPQDLLNMVTEAGLYSLILRSRKPEAKAFKRWVTHEVLPAIRRTGQYGVAKMPPMLSRAEIARNWYEAELAREKAEEQLAVAAPKADAWDVLASAHGDYSVREAAYMLNRDPAIDTGQNRLFRLLRDWGLIARRGIPYADHARHVRLRARHFTKPSGDEETAQQVRITAEGLRYLHRRLGGTEPLAA